MRAPRPTSRLTRVVGGTATLLLSAGLAAGPVPTAIADAPTGTAAAAGASCEGRQATVYPGYPGPGTSTPSGDGWTITGTPGDDVIVGSSGTDRIDGRGGDDVICGFGGADLLSGGAGDDVLVAGPGKARLRGGAGDDTLRAPRGSRSVLNGGSGDDRLESGSRASLRAGKGRDRLVVWLVRGRLGVVVGGGHGDRAVVTVAAGGVPAGATVTVDAHWSRLTVEGRRGWASWRSLDVVRLRGSDVHWVYRGSAIADRATVVAGRSSQLYGGWGHDRLTGGGGDDVLHGGPGRDVLDGRGGQDRCVTGEQVRRCES